MGFFGFGSNKAENTQQFGAPSFAAQQYNGYQPNPYGGMQGGMQGGGAMGMMQQAQNPMMQQAANDPIIATSQLLALHDPMSQFIISQNMALVLDLIGVIVMLSIKEFFGNVGFTLDSETGAITLNASSLPPRSCNTFTRESCTYLAKGAECGTKYTK